MSRSRCPRLRRSRVLLLTTALLASACGDDPGGAGSTAAGDPAMCEQLEADMPTPDFLDTVPAEYRSLAESILALSDDEDVDPFDDDALLELLTRDGAPREFSAFADLVEATCPGTEGAMGIRGFATIAELGAAPADGDYCDLLAASVDTDADELPPELLDQAPESHRRAFDTLQGAVDDGATDAFAELGAALGGLGLFLETQCGQAGAFGQFMLIAAFATAFGSEGVGGSSEIDPTTQPGEADPSDATAALPTGLDLEFTTQVVALQDDGEYLIRAVVPEGWVPSEPFLGVTFEPPVGGEFDIFTEISFDAGCDGMCAPTDWEARLTGPEGLVTRLREADDVRRDESLADGLVIVNEGFARGVDGRVVRWNDEADRYLSCEFSLGEESVELVEAFVRACTSSVPGWFPAG